jgi:hypothetical protein
MAIGAPQAPLGHARTQGLAPRAQVGFEAAADFVAKAEACQGLYPTATFEKQLLSLLGPLV